MEFYEGNSDTEVQGVPSRSVRTQRRRHTTPTHSVWGPDSRDIQEAKLPLFHGMLNQGFFTLGKQQNHLGKLLKCQSPTLTNKVRFRKKGLGVRDFKKLLKGFQWVVRIENHFARGGWLEKLVETWWSRVNVHFSWPNSRFGGGAWVCGQTSCHHVKHRNESTMEDYRAKIWRRATSWWHPWS